MIYKFDEFLLEYRNTAQAKLFNAVTGDDVITVLKCIDSGTGVDEKNHNGYTPLIIAAMRSNEEIVSFLLSRGADVNATNKYGDTALILACDNGDVKMAELLIDNGADISITNMYGVSATDHNTNNIWRDYTIQELVVTKQPTNIRIIEDKFGFLPSINKNYDDIISANLID